MQVRKLYPTLLVSNVPRAEAWCSSFFGRPPDNRPMASMVQWEFSDGASLSLCSDDELAATGAVVFYIDDLDAERARLSGLAISLGDDIRGDYSTLAQVRDPDRNLLTIATSPSRPFPGA